LLCLTVILFLSYIGVIVIFIFIFTFIVLSHISWTVPEEYRVWKEKMDAVESKKLLALQAASLIQKSSSSSSKFTNSSSRSENDSSVPSSGRRKQMEMDDKPAPSYASQAEATDAFKNMLVDKKVGAALFRFLIARNVCLLIIFICLPMSLS
jgi:hypothetical protein